MKKVSLILFLMLGGGAAYLYWVEPETLDRLLKRAPAEQPTGKRATPGRVDRPKPSKKTPAKANARVVIPETEAAVYINGKRMPAGLAKAPSGPVVVASYRDGHYSHEMISVPDGGEVAIQLRERQPTGTSTWRTFQGNAARTGFSSARDRQALELVWKADLGMEIESALIAVEDTAFFSAADHLLNGVDLAAGKFLWSQGTLGSEVAPIANSEHVFAGSDTGRFGGYRLKDGKPRGDRFIDSYPTSMALISEDAFLVTNGASRAYSIKTKKGFIGKLPLKVNWEREVAALAGNPSIPALSDGKAIFMTERTGLLALDLSNGGTLWSRPLSGRTGEGDIDLGARGDMSLTLMSGDYPTPSPTIAGDTVFAGQGTSLMACRVDSGQVLWQAAVEDTIASSLSCAYGMLFFGTAGGEVHAVSTVDGTTIYRVAVGVGATSAAPVVFADKLLVGNGEGRLFLFNCFSGERVAESDVLAGAGIMGSLLTDQYLVVANKKGLIARFE